MFEQLRQRLKDVQDLNDQLVAGAIAVANELRKKVRAGRRATSRTRRDNRRTLRGNGLSAKETRKRLGKRRGGSGVSITAQSTGSSVRLTASSQVQHLRRAQAETPDIMAEFAKHMTVADKFRSARGGL